jgi:diaminohydroxyphosphoribosylaminopyrimidine deaminase/5-amino-6-(5-phosphoribosylamino)uracil reductase
MENTMLKSETAFSNADAAYMRRALDLAAQARGQTSPNPLVGAVIVKDGRVIGEGWHRAAGEPHAEIEALNAAKEDVTGATMYVTLEPCCHYGKTPPCTEELIRRKIERVVVATLDPNPLVHGKGVEALRKAGIRVDVGLCEREARRLNEFFITYHEKKRPFVICKWAMTLDGKIATESGHSRWITNELSRAYVHELRAQVDAVMIGVGTVLMDNPLLTVRLEGYAGRQPQRIIVDGNLRIPSRVKCLTTAKPGEVLICTSSVAPRDKIKQLSDEGHEVIVFQGKALLNFHEVMKELAQRGLQSILCEGGASLTGALFEAQIVDKVIAFIAPKIVGGKNAKTPISSWGVVHMDSALSLHDITIRRFAEDVCVEGYLAPSEWGKVPQAQRDESGVLRFVRGQELAGENTGHGTTKKQ